MNAPVLTPGTGRCRCAACGRFFGGVGGFDVHQRLTGARSASVLVCLDPATLGLVERGGWWVRAVPAFANGVGQGGANGPAAVPDPSIPHEAA